MSYRIAQDAEYAGNDYWRWSAWIEEDGGSLEQVQSVEWILHPSFKRNRLVSTERERRFRLETSGWGTFRLRAELTLSDGELVRLQHELRLEYPADDESIAPVTREQQSKRDVRSESPTIFLSYSVQDSRLVGQIRRELRQDGFTVLDQTQLEVGEEVSGSLERMINRAQAVVGVALEGEISSWVRREIDAATVAEKPAFLVVGPDTVAQRLPSGIRSLSVDVQRPEGAGIAAALRAELSSLGRES